MFKLSQLFPSIFHRLFPKLVLSFSQFFAGFSQFLPVFRSFSRFFQVFPRFLPVFRSAFGPNQATFPSLPKPVAAGLRRLGAGSSDGRLGGGHGTGAQHAEGVDGGRSQELVY